MDFLTLAKKRYSVRAYTKQKVEKEKLDAILEAAHVAPTGGNCQPQHLIVVQSDEGLRKIGKATISMVLHWQLLFAVIQARSGHVPLTAKN